MNVPVPDMFRTTMGEEETAALLQAVAGVTGPVSCLVRGQGNVALADVPEALDAGQAVRLHYRFDGQEWMDVITPTDGAFDVVRVAHPIQEEGGCGV